MKRYWEILKRQKRPVKFLISRVLMRMGISSLFLIGREGVTLRFYPTSLSAQLWIDPMDRRGDDDFLTSYLRRGETVLDVGANVGSLAVLAASVVGPEGRVYAIEPHPRTYSYLKKNILLNRFSNVATFNVALGDREQFVMFSDCRTDDQNKVSGESGLLVSMKKLDDLGIQDRQISLLKIDVEGYEKFVIEGAAETLKRVSCIYFESGEEQNLRNGYSTRDILRLLGTAGFAVYRSAGERRIETISENYGAPRPENWIAVRSIEDFLERSRFTLIEAYDGQAETRSEAARVIPAL
ncbi:MAG TPA: FkbM family methyltransferase [Terriglobia bacterium]|nr:FkbM family methyltransferase [Terriglobia bacterium]